MRIRLAVVLTTALVMMVTAAAAQAVTCSETWTGGGTTTAPDSGYWDIATNWSPATVPISSSDNVCITGSGNYTVTVRPFGVVSGPAVATITLGGSSGTQTLEVEGEGEDDGGTWVNFTTLGIDSALTINANGVLALDATDNNAGTPTGGELSGGSAYLQLLTGDNIPVQNAGTIDAASSDSAWGSVIEFGGTLTNTGTIDAQSGFLNLDGQSPALIVDNTGAFDVGSGATVAADAGDGSSFTNDGSLDNAGSMTVAGSMHFAQSGGAESGNPVQIQSGATLDDSAGTGSFLFDLGGGFLTGTIPAGQTVEVQGYTYNCSGNVCQTTSLGLGGNIGSPPAVTNDGTVELDAPGSGTASGGGSILGGGTLDNNGTLASTVEDSNYTNNIQAPVDNAAGAHIDVGGVLVGQYPLTNDGTITVSPGSEYEFYGGSLTNEADGTLSPEIASASSFGSFDLQIGTLTAGGTVTPVLEGGYSPASGTEFQAFPLNGGTLSGTFASVGGGFAADYTHESTSPAYVGLVYGGGTPGGGGTTGGGGGTTGGGGGTTGGGGGTTGGGTPGGGLTAARAPTVDTISGGSGTTAVKLSCPSGEAACSAYTAIATVTEHLKGKKVTAITASSKLNVVVIAKSSGTLAAGDSTTAKLTLNATGKALLKKFGKLKAVVKVTAGGKTLKTQTVSITEPKQSKKKKKKKKG
jgi:hypothetical protein